MRRSLSLLLFKFFEKLGLIMAVALLFDLFALHVCCSLRLFLLGLRKKLLHLEPQALILLEHLIDGEFEEELIGVLYEV